jgi:hypothetical protein
MNHYTLHTLIPVINRQPLARFLTAAAGLALLATSPAQAGLVITPDQIHNNTYTYELLPSEMADDSTFGAEVDSRTYTQQYTGVEARPVGTPKDGTVNYGIVPSASPSGAYFTYKFDFARAGYKVDSVQFMDRGLYVGQETGAPTTTVTVEWSADGEHWTTLREITSLNGAFVAPYKATYKPITFEQPVSTVYYRVTFTNADGSKFRPNNRVHFGRSASGTTAPAIQAKFKLSKN